MKILFVLALFAMFMLLGAGSILGANSQIVFYLVMLVMGIGLAYYAHWFKKFAQKVNSILPLMETDPDAYIAETEKLLEGRRANNIRSMLMMNIAVAYMEKGDYVTAKQKLKSINGGALKKANGAVYFLNLTYVMIHLGENEQALDLIKKFKKRFLSLPMGGNLPRLNAFIQIFEAMENDKWHEATEQMKEVKENWPDKVTGVDYTILEKRLEEHNGSLQKVQA
ncbi:hypothetical protein [Anaerotignum sp. MB30-C6]|uniref:hypothetical protein n=1 Tax=Anaerotignum sp. MB30-C6 TaxID=3070814 RepID=UPI0027DC3EC1|nr:hypothetical protein [Anaerotignum sp. MB30-C6]WMI81326.1 hypothetical protein RBQ60_00925 [Anaerotignum sp. MB30-C6]